MHVIFILFINFTWVFFYFLFWDTCCFVTSVGFKEEKIIIQLLKFQKYKKFAVFLMSNVTSKRLLLLIFIYYSFLSLLLSVQGKSFNRFQNFKLCFICFFKSKPTKKYMFNIRHLKIRCFFYYFFQHVYFNVQSRDTVIYAP